MTVSQVNILDGSLHPLEMAKKKKKTVSLGEESFSWFSSPPAQGIFESVWAIIVLTLWQSKKKRLLVPFSFLHFSSIHSM